MANLYTVARLGTSQAAAATVTLPSDGDVIPITGTTGITAIHTGARGLDNRFILRFAGIVTLTNSSSLALPGGVDYATAAGEELEFRVDGSNEVTMVQGAGGAGSRGVVQAIALDAVATSKRLGVRAHGGTGIQDISDPTTNSVWTAAIVALSEYTRAFTTGAIAAASELWNGGLWLNLKASGLPPAVEVVGGAVHNFNPADPETTAFTINGSDDITAGDALADIETAIQATGGDFTDAAVSGHSALADPGGNVLTGGTPSADSGTAASAFDGNTGNTCISDDSAASPWHLVYDRGSDVPDIPAGAQFGLYQHVNNGFTNFAVESSPDNSTWTTIYDGSAGAIADDTFHYYTTTAPLQRYFRLKAISWVDESGRGRVFVQEVTLTSEPTDAILNIDLSFPASLDTVALPTVTGSGGTAGYTSATTGGLVASGVTVTQL